MNRFLKAIKVTVITVVGLFLLLVVLGWVLEDRITAIAVEQFSQTLEAPMDVEDVHFSLVRHFPLASIHFHGVWVGSPQAASGKSQSSDTLVSVGELYAYIDAIDAFQGIITVREVSLSEGIVHYEVDSTGATSFDFLWSSDTTVQSQERDSVQTKTLDFAVESISLNNVFCRYQDEQLKAAATLSVESISGELDIDSTQTLAALKGGVTLSGLQYGETNLHRMPSLNVDFDVFYHNDTIRTNAFSAQTKGLTLGADGDFILGEVMYSDMELTLDSESLATLLKYAPDTLLSSYDMGQVSGAVTLNTKLVGTIGKESIPNYEASLMLSDATIKYDEYPLAYNLAIDLEATNGTENSKETTEIRVNKLETDFDGSHISLQGSVSNLDRIKYDLKSNMDLDLSKVKKLIPDSVVSQLSGKLTAYVATSGILPDSIDDHFIRQTINASELDITLANVNLKIDSLPEVKNASGNAKFKPCQLELIDMEMYLPEYDLQLVENSISACVTGDLLNPKHMNVAVSAFRLGIADSSYVWGQASLDSMQNVSFDIQTDLNLDLGFWKQFIPDTLVNDMSGRFLAKIKSYGALNLDSVKTQITDILIDQTTLDLRFKEVTLDMKDTLVRVKSLSGAVVMKDHTARIDELQGSYAGINVRIAHATVENPLNTTIRNQPGFIKADGEYYFGEVDYKVLDALFLDKKSNASVSKPSQEPSQKSAKSRNWNLDIGGTVNVESFRYDSVTLLSGVRGSYQLTDTVLEIKGKVAVDRVVYGDAVVTDVTSLYNVKGSEYTFDQLRFDAFDGSALTALKIRKLPEGQMLMNIKATLDRLNMNTMVKQLPFVFEEYIQPEELGGVLTSDETYLQVLMEGNKIDLEELKMKSHILFEDGGFYNYPPVTASLSAMPSTKNHPDTLLFNTIETYLFIYQNALNIPKTKIVTNKLSAKMVGEQSFGEDYDYRVGINYKDVISKNKKVKAEKENQVEEDIDDVKLENLKWWKASGRKGKNKTIPIASDEFKKKEKIIGVRESWLDLKFKPKRFNFDTKAN